MCAPAAVIAAGLAGFDRAHLRDSRLEAHHGAHRVRLPRGRVAAEQGVTRTQQVVMRPFAEEDAGGIGERAGDARIGRPHGLEVAHLARIHRIAREFGADEVRHQQSNAGPLDQGIADERQRLGQGEAEPVHAGVHVQGRRERASGGVRQRRPFGEFFSAPQDRAQIVGDQRRAEAGEQAVEDVDHGPGRTARAVTASLRCATKNVRHPAAQRTGRTASAPQP